MRADQGKVCLVGSMEVEFNSIPEGLQAEVQSMHKELLAWLESMLAEGRDAGAFRFNGEPANKAALILSTLQGGLQNLVTIGTSFYLGNGSGFGSFRGIWFGGMSIIWQNGLAGTGIPDG